MIFVCDFFVISKRVYEKKISDLPLDYDILHKKVRLISFVNGPKMSEMSKDDKMFVFSTEGV